METYTDYSWQNYELDVVADETSDMEWIFEIFNIPTNYIEDLNQTDQIDDQTDQTDSSLLPLPDEDDSPQPLLDKQLPDAQPPVKQDGRRLRYTYSQGLRDPCIHKSRKAHCMICNPKDFCEHDIKRYYCLPCGGKGTCAHKRRRTTCKECGGGSICEHGKQRSGCRICRGPRRRQPKSWYKIGT